MTPIAQAVVDAAATADREANAKAVLDSLGIRDLEERKRYISGRRSRAVVVAVLETLAGAEKTFGVGSLEDLAAEIRGTVAAHD